MIALEETSVKMPSFPCLAIRPFEVVGEGVPPCQSYEPPLIGCSNVLVSRMVRLSKERLESLFSGECTPKLFQNNLPRKMDGDCCFQKRYERERHSALSKAAHGYDKTR